jgi:hypothetical protein
VIDVTADIGETKETIEETIRFATEINPHTIQVSIAAPYPGTYLHRQAVENAWLDHEHAELVDEWGVQIAPLHYPLLSHREIFNSVDDFYRRPGTENRGDRRRDGSPSRNDTTALARGYRVHSVPTAARRFAQLG